MPRSIAELEKIGARSTLLAGIVKRYKDGQEQVRSFLALPELNDAQVAEFDALTGSDGDRSLEKMLARADEIATQVERAARADQALGTTGEAGAGAPEQRADDPQPAPYQPARVTWEPTTYERGGRTSYFRDLTTLSLNGREGSREAAERMERNTKENVVKLREAQARGEQRALTTVDGAGGDFVPPLWMVNQYIELARAGRVAADRVHKETLPGGTDSINVPRIATGTAVAEQTTQNTAVQNTDATTGALSATVATLAGQQVVSVQLIEQSPINLDTILLADLAADYATKLDVFVLNNNAAGKLGLLNVSSVNAVTYTDASPTVGELYPKVADGIQQIHTLRFMPPDAILMHPRRWAWFLAALDTAGRPLVTPYDGFNQIAQNGGVVSEGYVGTLQGLPVYVDPSIPINLGAGTNEDRIIIARFADSILWEGNSKAEAFRETYANQLSVLLRFYNYVAFTGGRYPKSISVISGTGLVTPTF